MCVVCLHYQYFNVLHYIIIFILCFFLFYFLERKTEKRSKKKETKKIKKVKSRINFLYGNLFWSNYFFRLITISDFHASVNGDETGPIKALRPQILTDRWSILVHFNYV